MLPLPRRNDESHTARRRCLKGIIAVLMALCAWTAGPCMADDEPDAGRQDHLRAGYVFNFAKFVEWPASAPPTVLTVCFAGAEGVRQALEEGVAQKPVGARRLTTRAVGKDGVAGCQILYAEAGASLAALLGGASPSALLTIGEAADFSKQGGIVELFELNNHLRFNINLDNARRAGLKISSNLLQLASRVDGGSR